MNLILLIAISCTGSPDKAPTPAQELCLKQVHSCVDETWETEGVQDNFDKETVTMFCIKKVTGKD